MTILADVNDPTQSTEVIGECVQVDDTAICLPALEREPTACEDADDCVDEGFPVDALCGDDNVCLCVDNGCISSFEKFVAERCACFAINGESCQVDEECASRACVDDVCRAASGEPCTFSQECASGDCNVNDVCT